MASEKRIRCSIYVFKLIECLKYLRECIPLNLKRLLVVYYVDGSAEENHVEL